MAGFQESGSENEMQKCVLTKNMEGHQNEEQKKLKEPQTVEERKMIDMFNELDDDNLEKIDEQTYNKNY